MNYRRHDGVRGTRVVPGKVAGDGEIVGTNGFKAFRFLAVNTRAAV